MVVDVHIFNDFGFVFRAMRTVSYIINMPSSY